MRRIADALEDVAAQGVCALVITHDLELMERPAPARCGCRFPPRGTQVPPPDYLGPSHDIPALNAKLPISDAAAIRLRRQAPNPERNTLTDKGEPT